VARFPRDRNALAFATLRFGLAFAALRFEARRGAAFALE
jgi:hypothetical protein